MTNAEFVKEARRAYSLAMPEHVTIHREYLRLALDRLEAAEKRIDEWIKVGESAERPELLTLYHISGTNAMGRFVTIGYWTQAKGWKEWDGNTLKIDYYKPITKPQPPEPQP